MQTCKQQTITKLNKLLNQTKNRKKTTRTHQPPTRLRDGTRSSLAATTNPVHSVSVGGNNSNKYSTPIVSRSNSSSFTSVESIGGQYLTQRPSATSIQHQIHGIIQGMSNNQTPQIHSHAIQRVHDSKDRVIAELNVENTITRFA